MKKILFFFSLILFYQNVSAQYTLQAALPNLPAFSSPTDMEYVPDGTNRWVVLEQRGNLWIFDNAQDISTRRLFFNGKLVVSQNGCEAGLLGCAFHPNYANNHYIFLSYDTGSDPQWYSRIVRYQVSTTNPDSIIPSSAVNILTFAQPYGRCNHKGGCLRFGPDGYLYASFGDGGSGGDPDRNGQNKSVFLGKILRLDIDHQADGNNYAIPLDNPFANNTQGFKKEIYAYGLRNTWKFSFDKVTGKLWAGDVGQDAFEEVDTISNGGNYGWNVMEGFHCYPYGDFNCDSTGMTPPVWEYPHNGNSLAVTGGFVYHGTAIPALSGNYIYGDYVNGNVWSLSYEGSSPAINQQLISGKGKGVSISTFAEDQFGEIYAMDYNAGKILKLTSSASVLSNTSQLKAQLTMDRTIFDMNHFSTIIHYDLPEREPISLSIIDESGKEVKRLFDHFAKNGDYELDVNSFANGIYFLRLQANNEITALKFIINK